MSTPSPTPSDDDKLTVSDSANVEGIILTTLIILALFMCGGMLFWGGLTYWRKGQKSTIDLETLEGLIDNEGNKKKKKKTTTRKDRNSRTGGGRSFNSKKSSMSERSQSEHGSENTAGSEMV